MKCISKSFNLNKTFSIVQKIFETYIPSEYERKYKDLSIKLVIGLIYIMRGGYLINQKMMKYRFIFDHREELLFTLQNVLGHLKNDRVQKVGH